MVGGSTPFSGGTDDATNLRIQQVAESGRAGPQAIRRRHSPVRPDVPRVGRARGVLAETVLGWKRIPEPDVEGSWWDGRLLTRRLSERFDWGWNPWKRVDDDYDVLDFIRRKWHRGRQLHFSDRLIRHVEGSRFGEFPAGMLYRPGDYADAAIQAFEQMQQQTTEHIQDVRNVQFEGGA